MTPDEVRTLVEGRLQAFESSPPQLTTYKLLIEAAIELSQVSEVSAVDLVQGWMTTYERAGPALLEALAAAAVDRPSLCTLLLRLLWRCEGSRTQTGRELAERIGPLVPSMTPELRSVAFLCSPELLDADHWREGVDYVTLERRFVAPRSADEGFAHEDSVQGQRERLDFLGYAAGKRAGPWQLADRAAVTLFQLDNDLEATGVLDPTSSTTLDELAWGTLYLGGTSSPPPPSDGGCDG